jgi:hypothetical protein
MPSPRPDLSGAQWSKSSYSGGSDPESCVEVAHGIPHVVPVRDSKDPDGPALLIPAASWTAFVATVKAGHFRADA